MARRKRRCAGSSFTTYTGMIGTNRPGATFRSMITGSWSRIASLSLTFEPPRELADLGPVIAALPEGSPGVDTHLAHPPAQGVDVDAQLAPDAAVGHVDRDVLGRVLKQIGHQAHTALAQLIWILPRCRMNPPSRWVVASTRPGAVHSTYTDHLTRPEAQRGDGDNQSHPAGFAADGPDVNETGLSASKLTEVDPSAPKRRCHLVGRHRRVHLGELLLRATPRPDKFIIRFDARIAAIVGHGLADRLNFPAGR